jgi:hypothetical protein
VRTEASVAQAAKRLGAKQMRYILPTVFLVVVPSLAFPSGASAQTGYIEGSVGFVLLSSVDTENYSVITPEGELFEGSAEAKYNGELGFGAEGGFRVGPWRFGASWDFINAEVDTARLEGTLDGVPFTFSAQDEDLEDFGLDANNDMSIFAANAYYLFDSYNAGQIYMGVQPYIGLGAGVATFDNLSSQFAFLVTLGANLPLGPRAYLGGRYRLALVTGPEADSGIAFDAFTAHTFSLVLGLRFGV